MTINYTQSRENKLRSLGQLFRGFAAPEFCIARGDNRLTDIIHWDYADGKTSSKCFFFSYSYFTAFFLLQFKGLFGFHIRQCFA